MAGGQRGSDIGEVGRCWTTWGLREHVREVGLGKYEDGVGD